MGWAALGACMCVFGCAYECCGKCCACCRKKDVKARELDDDLDVEGMLSTDAEVPPAPYIMITG